jgi:hypothetical protein
VPSHFSCCGSEMISRTPRRPSLPWKTNIGENAQGLCTISVNLSGAALTNALRCRRTVSVCAVLRRAKRGRFAYFALKLTLMGPSPHGPNPKSIPGSVDPFYSNLELASKQPADAKHVNRSAQGSIPKSVFAHTGLASPVVHGDFGNLVA